MLISEGQGRGQRNTRRIHNGEIVIWMVDFERCLNKLTKRDRTLLLLAAGAGYRYREVARLTGENEWTVRRHVEEAVEQIQELVAEQQQESASPGVIVTLHAAVEAVMGKHLCSLRSGHARRMPR